MTSKVLADRTRRKQENVLLRLLFHSKRMFGKREPQEIKFSDFSFLRHKSTGLRSKTKADDWTDFMYGRGEPTLQHAFSSSLFNLYKKHELLIKGLPMLYYFDMTIK